MYASLLALVLIGGLVSSTLLTLVVVPVIYSLIESLRTRITGGDGGGPATPVEQQPASGPRIPPLKRLQ